jgi:hypothetical protein
MPTWALWRRAAIAPAALLIAGFALPPALWAETAAPLTLQERAEILDLLSLYSHMIDARQGEAFAALFTADGELAFPDTHLKGRAQLAAHAGKPRADGMTTLHLVGDTLLARTASGHVRGRSKVLFCVEDPDNRKREDARCGFAVYDDDIVKTPQGWRFARRTADKTVPIAAEFLPPGRSPVSRGGQ